jgi:hypothetical protein
MITYKIDDWMENLPKFKALSVDHYDEIEVLKEFPLDLDFDTYESIYRSGKLVFVTAKDGDELIGYIVFFVTPHIHSKNCLTAHEDIYFLKPEYRKGHNGIKLFKFAQEHLKSIGVDLILYCTKVEFDNSSLFKYLGCKPIDKVFTKLLQEPIIRH